MMESDPTRIAGTPLTRHWLIPDGLRPKVYTPHPIMSPDDIRRGTQGAWDRFYTFGNIWERSRCVKSLKARLAFMLVSKLYRQMSACGHNQSPSAPSPPPIDVTGTWSGDFDVQTVTARMIWTLTQSNNLVVGPAIVTLPNGIVLMNGFLTGTLTGSALAYTIS